MNQLNKNLIIFVALVGLQIIVILGLFIDRTYTLNTGREIALATLPVDPRDLIRGEYVDLRYEIGTVSRFVRGGGVDDSSFRELTTMSYDDMVVSSCSRETCLQVSDTVYVILTSYDNKVWNVNRVSRTKPTDFSVFLKGTVEKVTNYEASIYYGIEKYFVEAGSGLALERSGRLLVVVSVGSDGSAVIKRVEPTQTQEVRRGFEAAPVRSSPVTNSRDARRVADIKQLQLALELYLDANAEYAASLDQLSPTFIPEIPRDPLGGMYSYERTASSNYRLRALLEDPNATVLRSDAVPGDTFFDVAP
jgi:uncharacterized membrane-anchored protein